MIEHKKLFDLWRMDNPTARVFSRRQLVKSSLKQSRIYLYLVNEKIINLTNNMNYSFLSYGDNAAYTFSVGKQIRTKHGGTWCLNSLLKDTKYIKMIREFITFAIAKVKNRIKNEKIN